MTSPAAPVRSRQVRIDGFVVLALLSPAFACDRIWPREPDLTLPPIEDVRAIYRDNGLDAAIRYRGNVLEIRVTQPAEQIRQGGSLWARVGPWVYLFSPGTRRILEGYPGVAAVRVITTTANREIARASLRTGVLSDVLWRRSLNILGHALREGTQNPVRLQELAEWGERYGDYTYNPDFVPR